MTKPHKNNSDDFPEFYLSRLKHYAGEWVNKYSAIQIERVVLYRYDTDPYDLIISVTKRRSDHLSQKVSKDSPPLQYAIVFEISNCIELPIPENPKDIACIEFMKDCEQTHRYNSFNRPHPFLNSAFCKVYGNQTIKDFRKEWVFYYQRPGDNLHPNIQADKPFLILYDSKVSVEEADLVEPDVKKIDAIIRSLRFYPESDSEIKIQELRKEAKPAPCKSLGFKNNRTKEWKTFIKILQEPPHIFSIGSSSEYDADRKILSNIDRKLKKNFLSKECGLQIPKGFKTYERCPKEGKGIYKFKFQNIYGEENKKSKYDSLSKPELIAEIRNLSEKFQNITKDIELNDDPLLKIVREKNSNSLNTASKVALEKKWLTREDLTDIINPTS